MGEGDVGHIRRPTGADTVRFLPQHHCPFAPGDHRPVRHARDDRGALLFLAVLEPRGMEAGEGFARE